MENCRSLKSYLSKRYTGKLAKICIDGGFTCPNRDGKLGVGGCIFCGDRAAGENINSSLSISEQVAYQIKRLEKRALAGFIAYFQNFTGTYDTVDNLKKKYEQALFDSRVLVLDIGTRPDCVCEEKLNMLAEIKAGKNIDIWLEFGLQTSNDKTAVIINRCYKTEIFIHAVEMARSYGFEVIAHLIFGLPSETEVEMLESVRFISGLDIQGVKFHASYVMKDTPLEGMYNNMLYKPLTLEEYADILSRALAILPKNMVVHRFVSNMRDDLLIAPKWVADKNMALNRIRALI